MLYIVMDGRVYQKPKGMHGDIESVPMPLSAKTEQAIEEVWARWERVGRPFILYHEVAD